MDFWNFLLWLHLLAMAFFVGGQLVLVAAVVPVTRGLDDPEPMKQMARKFGQGTVVAWAVLIATGAAMASHLQLWGDWRLQLKLGLFALAAVFIFWHMKRPKMHALEGIVFLLSLAIVWLGVAIAA
jgi:uncharacterized membrane protein